MTFMAAVCICRPAKEFERDAFKKAINVPAVKVNGGSIYWMRCHSFCFCEERRNSIIPSHSTSIHSLLQHIAKPHALLMVQVMGFGDSATVDPLDSFLSGIVERFPGNDSKLLLVSPCVT